MGDSSTAGSPSYPNSEGAARPKSPIIYYYGDKVRVPEMLLRKTKKNIPRRLCIDYNI